MKGKTFGGFQLSDKIGEGIMGEVYMARQISIGRIAAVKILRERFARDPDYVQRFIDEARTAGSISHPNIVQIYDVGELAGHYYYAMEYVDGPSVQELLEDEGALDPQTAAACACDIASALEAAEEAGIVHRDVKPANILIGSDGVARLCDLGLAKRPTREAGTAGAEVVGTPYYMPPEQGRGEAVDVRSDIYALGATLYHMLTGQPPFSGPTPTGTMMAHAADPLVPPHRVNPDIPVTLSVIVCKTMAKDPAGRYRHASDLVDDLEAFLAGKRPAAMIEYGTGRSAPVTTGRRTSVSTGRVRPVSLSTGMIKKAAIAAGILVVFGIILAVIMRPSPDAVEAQKRLDEAAHASPTGRVEILESILTDIPNNKHTLELRVEAARRLKEARSEVMLADLEALIEKTKDAASIGEILNALDILREYKEVSIGSVSDRFTGEAVDKAIHKANLAIRLLEAKEEQFTLEERRRRESELAEREKLLLADVEQRVRDLVNQGRLGSAVAYLRSSIPGFSTNRALAELDRRLSELRSLLDQKKLDLEKKAGAALASKDFDEARKYYLQLDALGDQETSRRVSEAMTELTEAEKEWREEQAVRSRGFFGKTLQSVRKQAALYDFNAVLDEIEIARRAFTGRDLARLGNLTTIAVRAAEGMERVIEGVNSAEPPISVSSIRPGVRGIFSQADRKKFRIESRRLSVVREWADLNPEELYKLAEKIFPRAAEPCMRLACMMALANAPGMMDQALERASAYNMAAVGRLSGAIAAAAEELDMPEVRETAAGRIILERAGPVVDPEEVVEELSAVLSDENLSDRDKTAECDRIMRLVSGDPLEYEIAALRVVFTAETPSQKIAAARAYMGSYPEGSFTDKVPLLQKLQVEAAAFDEVVQVLRSDAADKDKIEALEGFVQKFPGGLQKEEALAMVRVYAAETGEQRRRRWLDYRISFPHGLMKPEAEEAVRDSIGELLGTALVDGDLDRALQIVRVYRDVVTGGRADKEIESLLEVLETPPGSGRTFLARRHTREFREGKFTPTLEILVVEWHKMDEARAFRNLMALLEDETTGREALKAAHEYLRHFSEFDRAGEVKLLSKVLGLPGTRQRLAAVKDYRQKYPRGLFADAVTRLEKAVHAERRQELFAQATDSRRTYSQRRDICNQYLEEYPESDHASRVRALVSEMEAGIKGAEESFGKIRKAMEAGGDPAEINMMLNVFLEEFRSSRHREEAMRLRKESLVLIERKQEDDDFKALMARVEGDALSFVQKAELCIEMLGRFPNGRHETEIEEALATLSSSPMGPHAGAVKSLVFSPDSQSLVIIDADARVPESGIWIWSLPELKLKARYRTRPPFSGTSAALWRQPNRLWVGERNGALMIWDLAQGKVVDRVRVGVGSLDSVAILGGNGVAVTAGRCSPKIHCWDTGEWEVLKGFTCPGGAAAFAVSPDGALLSTGGLQGAIALFEVESGKSLWCRTEAHGGAVDCLLFLPGGAEIASASGAGGRVCIWSVHNGTKLWEAEAASPALAMVGQNMLLAGSTLRYLDEGRVAASISGRHPIAASEDGRYICTTGEDGQPLLWYLPALLWK